MVSTGDTVSVHYTARLDDGEDAGAVVDTTDVDVALAEDAYYGGRDFEPLVFEVGAGEVLAPVEDAVRGMEPGETREVVVEPDEGFGPHSEDLVVEVPLPTLEERSDAEAAVGELVVTDDGQSGWITAVSGDTATVDFNHEFAGERLRFEVRLLDAESEGAADRERADDSRVESRAEDRGQ